MLICSQMPQCQFRKPHQIRRKDLRKRVETLRSLEVRSFKARERFAHYRYLAAVYALYAELRRERVARKTSYQIAKSAGLPVRRDTHPIRILIDTTSGANAKIKSRWTQAIRFAWHERTDGKDIIDFLRHNGGLSGCAAQFANLTPSRRRKGHLCPDIPLRAAPQLTGTG